MSSPGGRAHRPEHDTPPPAGGLPQIEPFGDAALRVRLPDGPGAAAGTLLRTLRDLPSVVDAVVAERHALVTFEPGRPPARMAEAIAEALAATSPGIVPREHVIEVAYDGEDLTEMAERAGVSRAEVARLHSATVYAVVAVGFLPGFAYLRGLDPRLVAPRRRRPRPRVTPLSVAIAGPYTGVYPLASPGGWNVIGTARDFSPFDPLAGARLALGDWVRFVAAVP